MGDSMRLKVKYKNNDVEEIHCSSIKCDEKNKILYIVELDDDTCFPLTFLALKDIKEYSIS